jgi:hypothetical protein
MSQLERQIMWESFSDELEKVALAGSAAQRWAIGTGLGGLTGAVVGAQQREGEKKTDALRRGALRGMAVGGLGALAYPALKNYPKSHTNALKHIKENKGAYATLGGVAVGVPAAIAAKKAIEAKVRRDIEAEQLAGG